MSIPQFLEIVRYAPGTFFFKGTKDLTDPMNTKSVFSNYGIGDNEYKWVAEDPHVAEIYASESGGSVWVYRLSKPTYVLRVYDGDLKTGATTTRNSLRVLTNVIDKYHADFDRFDKVRAFQQKQQQQYFKMLDNNAVHPSTALKLPFGLIPVSEQVYVENKMYTHVPSVDASHSYCWSKMFQRKSYHTYDKYLVLFMKRYRREILDEYLKIKGIDTTTINSLDELKRIGLNGYTAASWRSDWHGGANPNVMFHSETCLFGTEYIDAARADQPLTFVGRYKVVGQQRTWIGIDNKEKEYCNLSVLSTNWKNIRNINLVQTQGGMSKKSRVKKGGSGEQVSLFGEVEANAKNANAAKNVEFGGVVVAQNNYNQPANQEYIQNMRSALFSKVVGIKENGELENATCNPSSQTPQSKQAGQSAQSAPCTQAYNQDKEPLSQQNPPQNPAKNGGKPKPSTTKKPKTAKDAKEAKTVKATNAVKPKKTAKPTKAAKKQ